MTDEQPCIKLCAQLHDATLTKLTINYLKGTVWECVKYVKIKNKKKKKNKKLKRNFWEMFKKLKKKKKKKKKGIYWYAIYLYILLVDKNGA